MIYACDALYIYIILIIVWFTLYVITHVVRYLELIYKKSHLIDRENFARYTNTASESVTSNYENSAFATTIF